jgi:hypothetical protein
MTWRGTGVKDGKRTDNDIRYSIFDDEQQEWHPEQDTGAATDSGTSLTTYSDGNPIMCYKDYGSNNVFLKRYNTINNTWSAPIPTPITTSTRPGITLMPVPVPYKLHTLGQGYRLCPDNGTSDIQYGSADEQPTFAIFLFNM